MRVPQGVKYSFVYQTLQHWRDSVLKPGYREADAPLRKAYEDFRLNHGGSGLRHDLRPPGGPHKPALVVSDSFVPSAAVECWVTKALQMAGFDPTVLAQRKYALLRYFHLAGVRRVVSWDDCPHYEDNAWAEAQYDHLRTVRDWLHLQYKGVHVGRFAVATVMRVLKQGRLDLSDSETLLQLRRQLKTSIRYTVAGNTLLDLLRPQCILFLDRGYSGQGELFDLAVKRGIDTIAWNDSNRSNILMFKRYHMGNERAHPASLSAESWRAVREAPWKPEFGQQVRDLLRRSYESQDWCASNGNQFGKRLFSREETRQRLGLTAADKVAVVFPHILWDGSFFSGEDLFEDYIEWLVETLKAAQANTNLIWVVKLHPAHVVKARRESIPGRPSEQVIFEEVFTSLPPHVRLIHPEDEISTYSLYAAVDYIVTVRGTVGMEASVFGLPVVTAGTGRYDGRGFTIDSNDRASYLEVLQTLHTRPKLTSHEVEIAERYVYAALLGRPVQLSSMSLGFHRDAVASARVVIHRRTREDWLHAPDIRRVAAWLADGKTEDLFLTPDEVA